MKILIVSDTHRKDDNLKKVIEELKPLDMFIHLGDSEGSEVYIPEWLNQECEIQMVRGNNDFFSELPKEDEFCIGNYHVLITHGHYYYISMGTEMLKEDARARGFNLVMFGHTHRPYLEQDQDITILNPGSLSYPRQEGRKPSYILMDIDKHGEAHFAINYLS